MKQQLCQFLKIKKNIIATFIFLIISQTIKNELRNNLLKTCIKYMVENVVR